MRRLIAVLLFSVVTSAAAQQSPPPSKADVPPPPSSASSGFEVDPSLGPQVTIIKRGSDTVEETRVGGRVVMIKVTPNNGRPYYLIDDRGDGQYSRHELDSGVRVPQWVIHQF